MCIDRRHSSFNFFAYSQIGDVQSTAKLYCYKSACNVYFTPINACDYVKQVAKKSFWARGSLNWKALYYKEAQWNRGGGNLLS